MRKLPLLRTVPLLFGAGLMIASGCRAPQPGIGIGRLTDEPSSAELQQEASPYSAVPVSYEQAPHTPNFPVGPSLDGSWTPQSDSQNVPPPPAQPRWRFGNSTDSHAADCPCCREGMAQQENPLSRPLEDLNYSSDSVRPVSYQEGEAMPVPCPPGFESSSTQWNLPRWYDATGGRFTPPDELIFDGGDDGTEVLIDRDWTVRGLDQEDTVGHFDTLDGRRMVAPSNRVPIYAPRFGSVRRIYGIAGNEGHVALEGIQSELQVQHSEEVAISSTTLQQLQPRGQVGQVSSSNFRDRTRGVEMDNEVASSAFENRFSSFEDLAIIRYGAMDQDDSARLAEGIDAANSWGKVDAASAVIDNLQIDQLGTGMPAAETVAVEEDESRPKLRLVKVASQSEAQPGDIIEFSIRFDNVGNETIGNVTILDHLSPRLEIIEGSAQCSIEAEFFITVQQETSQIFRAEIVDPLPAGQGGIVRFKCLVR